MRRTVPIAALIAVMSLTANPAIAAPSVVGSITVGTGSRDIAITPNGAFLYLTEGGHPNYGVYIIDTASRSVVGLIPLFAPRGIAITPNGAFAYVAHDEDKVSVIDLATNTIVGPPIVGCPAQAVAITPDGAFAYVSNTDGDSVLVIDTSTRTVVGSPIAMGRPNGIAFTPDGAFAYVAGTNPGAVSVIDTSTRTVVGSPIPVGETAYRLAISPDGTQAYVTVPGDFGEQVVVIDTATRSVLGSPIPFGQLPTGVAFTTNGAFVYVAKTASTTVGIIDTSTRAVTTLDMGLGIYANPFGIVMSPNGAFAYVTTLGSGPDHPGAVVIVDTSLTPPPPPPTMDGGTVTSTTTNGDGSTTYTFQQASPSSNTYAMTVPAGSTDITVTLVGNANSPGIAVNVTMPAGQTKTVSLPRGTGSKICIVDKASATVGGSGACAGTNVPLPDSGCTTVNVAGDPGDGPAPTYLHPVTVCVMSLDAVVTVSDLKHSALTIVGDADNDGVSDDIDHCPGSVLLAPDPQTRAGHMDDSQTLLGCTRTQILECKSGNNNGERKFGLTPGSQNIFQSKTSAQPQGWANQCLQLYPNP